MENLLPYLVNQYKMPPRKRKKDEESDEENSTKSKKSQKIEGKTLEQHRRNYGDLVKAQISVEKYTIDAKTFVNTDCSIEVFKNLIEPNVDTITPSTYDQNTEVVHCSIGSFDKMREIFGSTKLQGGNKMKTWKARSMDIIFFPKTSKIRIWWTMS